MSNLLALKVKKPLVGAFLEDWLSKYGDRQFDLSVPKDQDDFAEAIEKMAKHVSHASPSGRISVLFDANVGVETIFIHVG